MQWSPDKSSVFGSSAEDGLVNIWDHEKVSVPCSHYLSYLPFIVKICNYFMFCACIQFMRCIPLMHV